MAEFAKMKGATILSVDGAVKDSEDVTIVTDKGVMTLTHIPDCCETVRIEDVTGDPADLVGGLVVVAEERTNNDAPQPEWAESWTWTFYEIRTTKGDLTLRWLGESNGYYGEMAWVEWKPADG